MYLWRFGMRQICKVWSANRGLLVVTIRKEIKEYYGLSKGDLVEIEILPLKKGKEEEQEKKEGKEEENEKDNGQVPTGTEIQKIKFKIKELKK